MKDYYKILGVEPSDSMITIKRVFRKLALKLHPDVNTSEDAHHTFIDLNEAFQVLGNPIKRKRYDQLYYVDVLQRQPSKEHIYKKKKEFWKKSVDHSAKKGHSKGQKRATKSARKSNSTSWGAQLIFDGLAELVWNILSVVFRSITE